jgi:hypothetical protein
MEASSTGGEVLEQQLIHASLTSNGSASARVSPPALVSNFLGGPGCNLSLLSRPLLRAGRCYINLASCKGFPANVPKLLQ